MGYIFSILLAILMGTFFVLSPVANGANADKIGTIETGFLNYLTAFITCLFIVIPAYMLHKIPTFHIENTQYYMYFGTLLGCITLFAMNWFAPKISAFYFVILPFVGQMMMGMILDYILLDVFEAKRLIGLLLIVIGLAFQQKNALGVADNL